MSPEPERLLALSMDLDALELYAGLHGSSRLSERAKDAVPARAAERLGELCASLGAPSTSGSRTTARPCARASSRRAART